MLAYLNTLYPIRYTALVLGTLGLLLGVGLAASYGWGWGWAWLLTLVAALLSAVGYYDLTQTRSSVLRNYPVIGHLRFLFEYIRPEIRQYFIEDDNDANPFSRAQRSLVYQRAKGAQDKRPFGTQLDVNGIGYEWINHSMTPDHATGP